MHELTIIKDTELTNDFSPEEVYDIARERIYNVNNDPNIVLKVYLDTARAMESVPDVEDIATIIDDMNQDIISDICFLFGLDEVSYDYVLGKYCHDIASDLDLEIEKILSCYNLSHFFYNEMVEQEPDPAQNKLFKSWR